MTSPLKPEELDTFRGLLDRREAQLRGEVQGVKSADKEDREGFQGVASDMVDIAQTKVMADFRHAERERDELELTEIANARARISEGTYGECVDCDEAIAPARLMVEPTAIRCIDCQEAYEKAHPDSAAIIVPTGRDLGSRPL